MARFSPHSVFEGIMERQFDFFPQSPHPSQTVSLMKIRLFGSTIVPRLRRRVINRLSHFHMELSRNDAVGFCFWTQFPRHRSIP